MSIFEKLKKYAKSSSNESMLQSRLEAYGSSEAVPTSLEELELSQSFVDRIIRPFLVALADRLSKMSPEESKAAAEREVSLAGNPYGWHAKEMVVVKIVVTAVVGFLAFLIGGLTAGFALALPIALGGAGIGFFLPKLWLRSKTQARQKDIIKTLPDALDLLTITVEAGMGFDGAMQKVAEKWDNEISRSFGRVVQEMRLGKLRREALKNMEENAGVPDMTSLVAAIIQADQLGVSVAKVLRVQSEQMRMKRRQRAEAEANKAPIKMLFPMVFLIFPALFIILLGPAALIIMETNFG